MSGTKIKNETKSTTYEFRAFLKLLIMAFSLSFLFLHFDILVLGQ